MSSKPNLFTPFTLRGVTFKNRIGVSPMITCSAVDGIPQDVHVVHYGNMAFRGFGFVIQESTAVSMQGRITPNDLAMIDDNCIPAYQRITQIVHNEGCKIGVQLSHSGRKGSQKPSQIARNLSLSVEDGGWELVAPSPIRHEPHEMPKELTIEEIKEIEELFVKSAIIAVKSNYDFIEIHAAHGYLVHEFLSPVANKRKDEYGCDSYENRTRFLKEIIVKVRKAIPEEMPLFVRLSCVDYIEGGIVLDDSIKLSKDLHENYGVDLIDCSSAGVSPEQNLLSLWNHQLPYAKAIHQSGVPTAAVGGICDGKIANDLIVNDETDVVLIGRGFLRDAVNPRNIAKDLGLPVPEFHKSIQREVNRIPSHCKY